MTLLTIDQAAKLNISQSSVRRLIARGHLAHVRLPVGGVRIAEDDLLLFLLKCRVRPRAYVPTAARPLRPVSDLAQRCKVIALARIGR